MTRGRFAPSPTGELHAGNARTALLAWLWARAEGGGFTLRVEDLDRPRCRPGLAARQLDELAWLGLDWDEGPYWQSRRSALYDAAIERLRAGGHVYECFCSRAQIKALSEASAPHGPLDEGPRYPGSCAGLTDAEREAKRRLRPPALRLRVPPGPIEFLDELCGPQRFDPQAEVGDFVLRRFDGIHSYQLAVVVDDAAMGVTQVLRGADLLPSTARQILLYRLLGEPIPRFAHAPLLHGPPGPDGQPQRLSKRAGAETLSAMRERGDDPGRLVAALARSLGLLEQDPTLRERQAISPRELLAGFSLARVRAGM